MTQTPSSKLLYGKKFVRADVQTMQLIHGCGIILNAHIVNQMSHAPHVSSRSSRCFRVDGPHLIFFLLYTCIKGLQPLRKLLLIVSETHCISLVITIRLRKAGIITNLHSFIASFKKLCFLITFHLCYAYECRTVHFFVPAPPFLTSHLEIP